MDDITTKDVTKEELQFLYKKVVKKRTKRKTNIIHSEITKGIILFISISSVTALILKVLN